MIVRVRDYDVTLEELNNFEQYLSVIDMIRGLKLRTINASYINLMCYSGCPSRKLLLCRYRHVASSETSIRIVLWREQPIRDLRILFQFGSNNDPNDDIFLSLMRDLFCPSYIAYHFIANEPAAFLQLSQPNQLSSKRIELIYETFELIKTAHFFNNHSLAQNHDQKKLAKRLRKAHSHLKNTGIKYQSVDSVNIEQLALFLEQWEKETGRNPKNDSCLLKGYLNTEGVSGGVLIDKRISEYKVVGLEVTSWPHPVGHEYASSHIHKVLRGYKNAGLLLMIFQAERLFREGVKWVLIGSRGDEGERSFKQQFTKAEIITTRFERLVTPEVLKEFHIAESESRKRFFQNLWA